MKRASYYISVFALLLLTACSQIMGNLRRDLNDEQYDSGPTMGGRWSEAGFLDDEYQEPSGRSPASDSAGGAGGRRSWVSSADQDANQRDRYRGVTEEGEEQEPSFSNTPNMAPPVKRLYKNGNRATRADFVDESNNEGSLWASDGQTNYYFTKNKVRGLGDIITIASDAALVKDTAVEIARVMTPDERDEEIELAQARINNPPPVTGDKKDQIASSAAAADRAPAGENAEKDKDKKSDKDSKKATWADVDLTQAMEFKAGDPFMAEIVQRYPNGNYKVRGVKKVRYRNGYRLINLVGVVKGSDITEDDQVPAGKLYEYRLQANR